MGQIGFWGLSDESVASHVVWESSHIGRPSRLCSWIEGSTVWTNYTAENEIGMRRSNVCIPTTGLKSSVDQCGDLSFWSGADHPIDLLPVLEN